MATPIQTPNKVQAPLTLEQAAAAVRQHKAELDQAETAVGFHQRMMNSASDEVKKHRRNLDAAKEALSRVASTKTGAGASVIAPKTTTKTPLIQGR